jgi:hypothetical protein
MRSVAARLVICGIAFLVSLSWVDPAHAQLGVGTTWLRTDAAGKGITLKVEGCCNGGLRFIWQIPPAGGQPAYIMTVDSPMDGKEAPALVAGKPSGETMAVTRVDDHHYNAVVKMNGQPFGTSNGTVAPDDKKVKSPRGKDDHEIDDRTRRTHCLRCGTRCRTESVFRFSARHEPAVVAEPGAERRPGQVQETSAALFHSRRRRGIGQHQRRAAGAGGSAAIESDTRRHC